MQVNQGSQRAACTPGGQWPAPTKSLPTTRGLTQERARIAISPRYTRCLRPHPQGDPSALQGRGERSARVRTSCVEIRALRRVGGAMSRKAHCSCGSSWCSAEIERRHPPGVTLGCSSRAGSISFRVRRPWAATQGRISVSSNSARRRFAVVLITSAISGSSLSIELNPRRSITSITTGVLATTVAVRGR